jgi:beta-lactamase regulating signal transducer with metallopeptidase domain
MNISDAATLQWDGLGWLAALAFISLKGAAAVAAAALMSLALRRARASVRHTLWCVALCGLLLMPLLSYAVSGWQLALLPAETFATPAPAGPRELSPSPVAVATGGGAPVDSSFEAGTRAGARESSAPVWPSALLLLWLAGAAAVTLRLFVGLACARRLARQSVALRGEPWESLTATLSARLGLARAVPVLLSESAVVPFTCGLFSPVLILPRGAEGWTHERRVAVLLHELAHVRRRDVLTQALAQLVCAVHWLNPLAWYAARQLRKEQEWACDERVVESGVAARDYARHLLDIARDASPAGWSATATTAMARSPHFEERLREILSHAARRRSASRLAAVSITAMLALLATLAATGLARANSPAGLQDATVVAPGRVSESGGARRSESSNATGVGEAVRGVSGERPSAVDNSPDAAARIDASGAATNKSVASVEAVAAEGASQSSTAQRQPAEAQEGEMTPAVHSNFSAEELNHLRNNGVGPEYVLEMESAGYGGLTAAQLVALYSNGVRAAYVAELRRAGYSNLPAKELIALRSNGIDSGVIESFKAVEYADFRARNYIAFKSNGVPPSYLREMKSLGYRSLTPKQIVDMWVAGVTPDFVRKTRASGRQDLTPEQLIELREQ